MALNDGFATDSQGRRIYFPPIGQPRLVPSREKEAIFNERGFWCTVVAIVVAIAGLALLIVVPEKPIWTNGELFLLVLGTRAIAPSVLARRWPTIPGNAVSYGRFVIATLSHERKAVLVFRLLLSGVVAMALVVIAAWGVARLLAEWSVIDSWENALRLILLALIFAFVPFCALHFYRVYAALRWQHRNALSA